MSEPVAIIARITVRDDAVEAAEAALRGLAAAASQEQGAVEYVLNREGDTGSFWFYEVYADQAAFDAHGKNPALAEAFGTLGGLLAEPPEMHVLRPLQAKGISL